MADDFTLEDAQAAIDNAPHHAIRILRRQNADLRARLAEAEEKIQAARDEAGRIYEIPLREARARLAEVEAELDELRGNADSLFAQGIAHWNRAQAAEAALARVEALCDLSPLYVATADVRAALRGPQDEEAADVAE